MLSGFQFMLGDLNCWSIRAGQGRFRAKAFFANAPEAALEQALVKHNLPLDFLVTPFNCLLVQAQDQLVLFDTGTRGDNLADALDQVGISVEQISIVVLSHAHLDHIGGALRQTGHPTFPNAHYLLSHDDWREIGHEQTKTSAMLKALGDHLLLIDPPLDTAPGIQLLPAPGHTPGQMIGEIISAGQRLIYTADVLAHPIHIEHPEWHIVSDVDPTEALITREWLLAEAAISECSLFVYHFPLTPLCQIEQQGQGYKARQLMPC